MQKVYYRWDNFETDTNKVLEYLKQYKNKIQAIYAIPKGGLVLGVKLANILNLPLYLDLKEALWDYEEKEILFVDEISDTGKTIINLIEDFKLKDPRIITLHIKENTQYIPDFYVDAFLDETWIVYPWEERSSKEDQSAKEDQNGEERET